VPTVTPGCSSIISITTFLGLLGLVHLDLKKDLSSTIKLAIIGVVVLTLLNAVRILILIWVGYSNGAAEFWSLHNWVGYALFFGFYLVAIPLTGKMS
jgi:exosortase/archaeosortase family protein